MEDTSQDVAGLVRTVVMSKSVAERILLCAQMYEDAKKFARIMMPKGLTADEQELYVFQRIHGMTPAEAANRIYRTSNNE